MKIILSILSILSCLVSQAQVFVHFNVENGLANNTVSSIAQDSHSRMWFATHNGLSRYDGYEMVSFRYDEKDEHTIQSNFVNYVYSDRSGDIWACTASGLSRFSHELDRFDRITCRNVDAVEFIMQVADSLYLLSTMHATYVYDRGADSLSTLHLDGEELILQCAGSDSTSFVMGTKSGKLYVCSFADSGFLSARLCPSFRNESATSIMPSGDNSYWVSTDSGKLLKLDTGNLAIETFRIRSLTGVRIESIDSDNSGNVWLGTKSGILVFNPTTGQEKLLLHNAIEPSSLSCSIVRVVKHDNDGNMWVGSSYGGIDFMNARSGHFTTIRSFPGANYLSDQYVKALCVDFDGTVWVATRNGGLNRYFPETGHIDVNPDVQYALYLWCPPYRKDILYAGTRGNGVLEVNKKTGAVRQVARVADVNCLAPAFDGCIWIASLSGLFLFNPETESLSKPELNPAFQREQYLTLMTDSKGNLWAGTKNRLHLYRTGPGNEIVEATPEALKTIIRPQCLFEYDDGSVWIGTSDGLLVYKDGVLSHTRSSFGPISHPIMGIESDRGGNLWLGTYSGLQRYSLNDKSLIAFSGSDGLQGSDFLVHSHGKSSDGTLYFGGSNGMSFFDPSLVDVDYPSHTPVISRLSVLNKEVRPGDDTGILEKAILLSDKIVLCHFQNAFSLHFSCPNFTSEGNDSFAYMLEGFDDTWTETKSRVATYTNLKKGTYTFRLKSFNRNGVVADNERILKIRIKPIWYNTLAFEVFTVVLLASILILFVINLKKRLEKKNKERVEEVKKHYSKKLLYSKLQAYCPKGVNLRTDESQFLDCLVDRMEENLSNNTYSIESLASDMCMSRSNLFLKTKKITGISPVELLVKIRIEKSCELIEETSLTISEIAEQSGFSSTSYFSTCFKRSKGISPSKYRKH